MTAISYHDWHYPRPGFTQTVYQSLASSAVDGYRLFGPRRIGKTQFLLFDLGHRALLEGHRVVYSSFWTNMPSPIETLAEDCARVIGARSPVRRISDWMEESTVHLERKILGTSVKVEHKPKASAEVDAWGQLGHVLDRLNKPAKPAFLFLDEFQAIAEHPDALVLLTRLREMLTHRSRGVKVIFTGSSQRKLREIFGRPKSGPGTFHGFAPLLDLEPLPDDFVQHQLEVAHQAFRHSIPKQEALSAFEKVCGRNPEMFRSWIMQRVNSPKAAPHDFEFDMSGRQRFEAWFARLKPRARIMARLIAEEVAEPQGQAGAA